MSKLYKEHQQCGGLPRWHWCIKLAVLSISSLSMATSSLAQTTLPKIVVTSPSPVKKKPLAQPQPTPGTQQQSAASSAPETTPEAVPPLAGGLIIVDDTFVPVTVVTEQEVLSNRGPSITDTLQQKAGITGTTFAPAANRPIIRGLDSYRVRVQENGIGSHDVSALSEDHAVPIDPSAVKRIEVIRGPATLRYGSQAIGGVVSVENERIPTFIPMHGYTAEFKGGFSSVDDGRDGAFSVTSGADNIVLHADGFRRKTEDYDSPRGTVENSFTDSKGGAVGASYVWSRGYFGMSMQRTLSEYGVPGEEDEDHKPIIDLKQDKLALRGEWRPIGGPIEAFRGWFGVTDYDHDELVDEGAGLEVGSRFTNKEFEGRFEAQHGQFITSWGALDGAAGVQFGNRKERGQSFEGESLLEPVDTRRFAGFIFEELEFAPGARLQIAGRLENTEVDGRGWSALVEDDDEEGAFLPTEFEGNQSFLAFSASSGLLYDFAGGVTGRVTGQYVERAPNAAELFSKGIHEATGTFEVGNPFLDKEKASTVEVGLKRAKGAFRFDTSVFATRYNGFIYRDLAGAACEGEKEDGHIHCEEEGHHDGDGDEHGHGAFDLVNFRQRTALFYGLEIEAQYDVAPVFQGVWGIEGQYDLVRAKFKGDNVPRIPPHRLGGGLYYRDNNVFARVGILHALKQDKVNAESEELTTPGYTLVNAELSYTTRLDTSLSGPDTSFTIGVKGENLTDEKVLNHSSFKRRENVLQPGASVKLFGKIKLN